MILDAVGGREPWLQAIKTKTLKNGWNGGRYVVMSGDEPLMQIHNWWQALKFLFWLYGRSMWTPLWPRIPKYIWHVGLDLKPGHLEELGKLVEEGKLRVVLDPISPVPLDIDCIKLAFHLMESRHAHGKVMVQI